jgi:hypothetical protein
MSSKKAKTNILRLENRRERILSELLDVKTMLRGSFATILTKCGKDNCWCKEGKGHPHPRITWSEKGRPFTRKVPRDYIEWISEVTSSFRQFRALRRKMVKLEAEIKTMLDVLENDMIEEARKNKDFLAIAQADRKGGAQSVPKKDQR